MQGQGRIAETPIACGVRRSLGRTFPCQLRQRLFDAILEGLGAATADSKVFWQRRPGFAHSHWRSVSTWFGGGVLRPATPTYSSQAINADRRLSIGRSDHHLLSAGGLSGESAAGVRGRGRPRRDTGDYSRSPATPSFPRRLRPGGALVLR